MARMRQAELDALAAEVVKTNPGHSWNTHAYALRDELGTRVGWSRIYASIGRVRSAIRPEKTPPLFGGGTYVVGAPDAR